ncbi:type I-F CRISPR-associated helicase Cas3f [Rubripirellula obstinata]|uniref:type I-F CRISPR-associated helicase Cas3f n=1 Tax=Rubripirellula obstinata TaxID=406547 RepID=UPI001F30AE5A|nr:type I-F CRISPR-associated helicase Cas3f [Rubripirellula obstinata]
MTFVSECQKKSLKLTRQVLDAYAHRIGQRTWQAVMTEQGLQAVRSRLSKTARKTTAVACHRIRGTRRTELLWIVGNRDRFDTQGNVPVNRTGRDLLREHDEDDWQYLSMLKSIVAIAGLFHDFGKAWDPFQAMLKNPPKPGSDKRDPVRHEWVSMLLFLAFVEGKDDAQWLMDLARLRETSAKDRKKQSRVIQDTAKNIAQSNTYPFDLAHSTLTNWIAWLILSHHRLPRLNLDGFGESCVRDESNLLEQIDVTTGFEKTPEFPLDIAKHWKFKHELPWISSAWCKEASRWGRKLGDEIQHFGRTRIDSLAECQRLLLTLSRMTLMLGDHQYSSKPESKSWPGDWPPFANTYSRDANESRTGRVISKKGAMRQRLDEHLVYVTEAAVNASHLLPKFETELPTAQNIRPLRKPSPAPYQWQNKAVDSLRRWQQDYSIDEMGFFAVNMASTGKGKTFANAKIMDAISPQGLRYSLALGLRTLTLQTGDEYREKLRLDQNELAILVGSAAVRALHAQRGEANVENNGNDVANETTGSESHIDLSAGFEFAYDDLIPDDAISTKLPDAKSRQLLKSPVLVCTIDHLMPAVENTRGGRQILPMLRLLAADLVIDEVDDFDHSDMPAIARLVHLAGMLGRKVMISSATIPPAISEGLFHAYASGWALFAKFRNRQATVAGFWVDEYVAKTARVANDDEFAEQHREFVQKRVKNLNKETKIACRAEVRQIADPVPTEDHTLQQNWFRQMTAAAIDLHRRHALIDGQTGKHVSVGVLRLANVEPCIDLAKHLLTCELPDDIELRAMTYHARQVLLLRSEQEKHLDAVLNRKQGRSPFDHPVIRSHIDRSDKPHVIFAVVASPVAEVGRDHDYDWAVIEPSSMRSIIQMAGRVRRHRLTNAENPSPNIILPQLNFKAFTTTAEIVFHRPGFEGGQSNRGGGYQLLTKRVDDLVDTTKLAERLDASSRIECPDELLPESNLVHLEHRVLRNILTQPDYRPAFVQGWTQCAYYLTDLAQPASRFRQSEQDSAYKLHLGETEDLVFRHVDPDTGKSDGPLGKTVSNLRIDELPDSCRDRLWLSLDYAQLIEIQQEKLDKGRRQTCEFLGEIRLRDDEGNRGFVWTGVSGARRE